MGSRSVRLAFLGPPTVEQDGSAVRLPYRRATALLACLAADGPRTRAHLARLIWGDQPPEKRAGNLRHAVHTVRRLVPGLLLTPSGRLELGPCDCDLHRFQDASPEEAAALVRGAFCQGLELPRCEPFEDWLGSWRRRWEARNLAVLERLAEERLRSGQAGAALEAALQALMVDGDRAPAHELVLRSHLARGERALALRHLERLRQRCLPVPERLEKLLTA